MDIYTLNLTGLLALCGALFAHGQTTRNKSSASSAAAKPTSASASSQLPFLTVYALVMTSDWLQGPFLYSLYTEEHHLTHSLISALFTTGFLSGAVSGAFIGSLADKYGRKRACLFFCVSYALSCLFTMFPGRLLINQGLTLVLGRVLGGLSTSLLFSVFESWMVADFEARGLGSSNLSGMFGTMSMVNSLVAIASGVVSEWLVGIAGTKKAPFMASVVVLGVAFGVIALSWVSIHKPSPPKSNTSSTLSKILSDPKILCLGLASTIFEGSMFLFVFFWTPALRSTITSSSSTSTLPYGVIFASFMASCLASSLAFNTFMSGSSSSDTQKDKKTNQPVIAHPILLLILLGISSVTFFVSAHPSSEQTAFWVFCLYEAAVGAYWPTMGTLKGKLIDDGIRSQVYGFLRVPLNVFVVVSLMLAGDGAAGFVRVFETCGMLLSGTVGVLW
ncbi:Protein of unknown function (DUF791) domain containing protein, partial [Rhypophila sp. PSN 637]